MSKQHFELGDPQLEESWSLVEQRLQSADPAKPQPGFSRRWLKLQQQAHAVQEKQRAMLFAMLNGAVTLGLLVLLIG